MLCDDEGASGGSDASDAEPLVCCHDGRRRELLGKQSWPGDVFCLL